MNPKLVLLIAVLGGGLSGPGAALGQDPAATNAPAANRAASKTKPVENSDKQLREKQEAEARQLKSEGKIELTRRIIANAPPQLIQKTGWMDAEFVRVNNLPLQLYLKDSQNNFFAFQIRDQNGDFYGNCLVGRETPLSHQMMGLKRGDHVRLIGQVVAMVSPDRDSENSIPWFQVSSIEKILPPAN